MEAPRWIKEKESMVDLYDLNATDRLKTKNGLDKRSINPGAIFQNRFSTFFKIPFSKIDIQAFQNSIQIYVLYVFAIKLKTTSKNKYFVMKTRLYLLDLCHGHIRTGIRYVI